MPSAALQQLCDERCDVVVLASVVVSLMVLVKELGRWRCRSSIASSVVSCAAQFVFLVMLKAGIAAIVVAAWRFAAATCLMRERNVLAVA